MKIIGTLDTKDDGDMLNDVINHAAYHGLDAIFAYNDGSTDNTEQILRQNKFITKYVNRSDFSPEVLNAVPQHRRHHLLKMVMDEYSTYNTEEIWIVRLEGDRYLMNSSYREMITRAKFSGHVAACGVMVDCRIGPQEDWYKLDTYPNWHAPPPVIQDWGRIDDVHPIVAFKVEDGVMYNPKRPRPWPVIWGSSNYVDNDIVNLDMEFFAHHGRRGPKYWSLAYGPNGIRTPSKKWSHNNWDFSSPESAYNTVVGVPFRPPGLYKLPVFKYLKGHYYDYATVKPYECFMEMVKEWNLFRQENQLDAYKKKLSLISSRLCEKVASTIVNGGIHYHLVCTSMIW